MSTDGLAEDTCTTFPRSSSPAGGLGGAWVTWLRACAWERLAPWGSCPGQALPYCTPTPLQRSRAGCSEGCWFAKRGQMQVESRWHCASWCWPGQVEVTRDQRRQEAVCRRLQARASLHKQCNRGQCWLYRQRSMIQTHSVGIQDILTYSASTSTSQAGSRGKAALSKRQSQPGGSL